MIANLLKMIFFYCVYRFIKALIKGYIIKKVRTVSEDLNNQMNNGSYRTTSNTENSNSKVKTFDAEYKVMKD